MLRQNGSFFYSVIHTDFSKWLAQKQTIPFSIMPTTFITLVQRPDDEQHHDTDKTEWLLCIFPMYEWRNKIGRLKALLWFSFTNTWTTKIDGTI